MSLSKFLTSIGLDEKAQRVYLALLKLTDAPASNVARKAGLPKSTAYHHLEHLVKLGLASSYRSKNVRHFFAESPSKIKGVFEGKIALFEKYLPELQKVSPEEKFVNLRLFEGEEGMRQIIEEELNCKEKLVRSVGSAKDLRRAEGGKISFTQRRLEKKVFSKCIRPENDDFDEDWLETQEEELREVRLMPENFKVSGMIFIFDNKTTVITPEEEGVGFIIESNSLGKTMKTIFDALWQIAREV